jgi:hypothetical protein
MSEDTTPPTPDDLQTLKLGDGFDSALIGITIEGQFVYSLNKLTELTEKQLGLDTEKAQGYVAHQAMYLKQTHGANSPVFVDDGIAMPKEEEPQIVLTDAPAPEPKADNVILIPGVTHGAVKGFIAPDELHS